MRCKTIVLLALALASSVRVAMAINDLPYCLFTYMPDAPQLDLSYNSKVPYLGEKLSSYNGISPCFKVFVPNGSFGWTRPYARGVPEKWPVDFGWMNAYPVEGYDVEKPRGFMMTITKNAE